MAEEISPNALEVVNRFDAIFALEREINGQSAAARCAARQQRVRPMIEDLHNRLRAERAGMSKSPLAGRPGSSPDHRAAANALPSCIP
ncbi:transposase [Paracoccus sp. IB05]|nr:transposase [Paracoccus sp. IB05]